MVASSPKLRKIKQTTKNPFFWPIFATFIAFCSVFLVAFNFYFLSVKCEQSAQEISDTEENPEQTPENKSEIAEVPDSSENITGNITNTTEIEVKNPINFDEVLEPWLKKMGYSNVGIEIYDLDREEISYSHNGETKFNLASIYKLFYVYKSYERIDKGELDGGEYFADGKTRSECLDLIIRESYNPCAEPLRREMQYEIDNIIKSDYGILEGVSSGAYYATPHVVNEMLKIYYEHKGLSPEIVTKIKDSMLNQPATTYDWRAGLPKGFSVANVYNKVGFSYVIDDEETEEGHWDTYDDAAIVEFEETGRHFAITVLTGNISPWNIKNLGTIIETNILENL